VEENNNGSGRSNCLLAIHIAVLAGWQTPDDWYSWAAGAQHGDFPGCFDLVGHNKNRALLRLVLPDQHQGQSRFAITVEVNLDQTGAIVFVICLKESFVVILEVGQGDDFLPRILTCNFML